MGFDYLTVSVPTNPTAEMLLHHSEHDEPGHSHRGFKMTEKRMCMGGFCWRKFEPTTPSKAWGREYESWDYSGAASATPIHLLRHEPARPSRIDIAFDYCVQPDLYPMDLEALFLDHCESRGIDIEWKGKRLQQTVYVGSQQSDRRIRIYRRDLKNLLMAEDGIHTLRVELVLRGDMVRAFWRHYVNHGEESAYQAAASHVLEMIGYAPLETAVGVPDVLRTNEDAEAYQMLFQFITQNACMIEACTRCGIDLAYLARTKVDRSKSRTMEHRLNKRVSKLAAMEPEELQRMLTVHL